MTAIEHGSGEAPDFETIRTHALRQGGVDPMCLRFRIVEFEKSTGEMLGVPVSDLGFRDAVETAAELIVHHMDSHFQLEPVGFLQ